jgi:hypothetical protein
MSTLGVSKRSRAIIVKTESAARRTLADDLRLEDAALHRRFIAATAPKRPLSLDEARQLSERMTRTLGPAARRFTRAQCEEFLDHDIKALPQ